MDETDIIREKADVAWQLATQKRLYARMRRQRHWQAAKLLFYQNAECCRSVSSQLIGWRIGMVIIYATTVLISALFWEIVVGYNFAMLALGLLVTTGIATLHFIPGDNSLERERELTAAEFARIRAETMKQRAVVEHLQIQRKELSSHLEWLCANSRIAAPQPAIHAPRPADHGFGQSGHARLPTPVLGSQLKSLGGSLMGIGCSLMLLGLIATFVLLALAGL